VVLASGRWNRTGEFTDAYEYREVAEPDDYEAVD